MNYLQTDPITRSNLLFLLAFPFAIGALGGCGSNGDPGFNGFPDGARLVVLDPPGDALGMTYNDRITLRVRYEKESGQTISGSLVEFALVATSEPEDTAGSTLSNNQASTNSLGVAQVDLVVGAQEATFRVSVDAQDAPTAYFHINVSEGGFTRLYITPVHDGWRAEDSFSTIQVRLYRRSRIVPLPSAARSGAADVYGCASLDVDDLPDSLAPPRSLDSFGGTVDYLNVNAGQPHAIVAWTEIAESATPIPVGAGCVDLGGTQLPNSRVHLDLVVSDRDLVLDGVAIVSQFDLEPVSAVIEQGGADRPWRVLACPAGPGQLLLDCALDAAAPDGALDCVVTGSSALVDAVSTHRGAPDGASCRPEILPPSAQSLDRMLTDAVAAGAGFPVGDQLLAALAMRSAIADSFTLGSEVSALSSRAARHRLIAIAVGTASQQYTLDLSATSRPVVDARPVGVDLFGDRVTVGTHAFTLRYGSVARDGFTELALVPAGLGSEAETLGTALARSVRDDSSGQTGCAGFSAITCAAISQPDSCLLTACQSGSTALDGLMTDWWRMLDGPGLDFALASDAVVASDPDGDLLIDEVGAGADSETPGTWSATMTLANGEEVAITGEF
ncbi:MAG: hypothetical protein MJE77_02545 [Proteobacteria bacterium]|nr:hypothetical protein [Pseudomonadota bacterium]